jgi:hypothetical protein
MNVLWILCHSIETDINGSHTYTLDERSVTDVQTREVGKVNYRARPSAHIT